MLNINARINKKLSGFGAKLIWPVLLFGLVVAIHLTILNIGFFADDFDYVLRARTSSPAALVRHAFLAKQPGGSWRPLSEISLTIPLHVSEDARWQYIISIGLLALLSVLVFYLIREFFPTFPNFTAVLIALAGALVPAHMEPVAWLAARGDLLVIIFGLAAIIFWKKEKSWLATFFYASALLSKETWILLPLALFIIKKPRTREVFTFGFLLAGWFLIRQYITGFVIGGYALPAPLAGNLVIRIWREAAAIFASGFLFGLPQSAVAEFARAQAGIIVGAALIILIWLYKKATAVAVPLLVALILLAPAVILNVPVVSGAESVAEQRYWFAPTLFLAITFLVFFYTKFKHHWAYLIIGLVLIFFGVGTAHEIKLFKNAGQYRDQVIADWGRITRDQTTPTLVLLPDTWQGVHLFAEPFFSDALKVFHQPGNHTVLPTYQICGKMCAEEAVVRIEADAAVISAPTKRFFTVGQKPRLKEVRILVPKNGLFVWTGLHWQFISKPPNGPEKPSP